MSSTGDGTLSREETLVQYVLVRRDLQTSLGWPLGSVIAQGCHAVSALMWEKRENSNVAKYCANIDSMHKVMRSPAPSSSSLPPGSLLSPYHASSRTGTKFCTQVVLGVKDSKELLKFAQKLSDADMQHRVWVEQPENDPTALAVLPYPRSQIQPLLKKLPLLK